MNLRIKKNYFSLFFWTIAIASFLFQTYETRLSSLIIPCLGIFMIIEIPNFKPPDRGWIITYVAFLVYLCVSMVYTLIRGNEASTAIRFFVILLAIPIAQNINEDNFEIEWKIFKILSVVKFITIFYTWIIVFVSQDYWQFRVWAREKGVGDVYIVNGIPRVQLIGTSLFVMAFVYSVIKKNRISFFSAIMAIGALMAGNSAYILGIFAFLLLYYKKPIIEKLKTRSVLVLLLVPIVIAVVVWFIGFSIDIFEQKAEFSNKIRQEQIEILMDTNPIFGSGLGNQVFSDTTFRKYSGNIYFEVQTAYIYNQIGSLGLILFYILTFYPYLGKMQANRRIAYIVYLLYAFWNPNCFDSTHAITMIMITNLIPETNLDISNNDREDQ